MLRKKYADELNELIKNHFDGNIDECCRQTGLNKNSIYKVLQKGEFENKGYNITTLENILLKIRVHGKTK